MVNKIHLAFKGRYIDDRLISLGGIFIPPGIRTIGFNVGKELIYLCTCSLKYESIFVISDLFYSFSLIVKPKQYLFIVFIGRLSYETNLLQVVEGANC